VLVYGDTNSTLAAALAASKIHIPIAHVEAGLRSFNKRMPEELNRILTGHCSSLLFTPTDIASQNLLNEGFTQNQITQVGDVMLDVALLSKERAQQQVSAQLLQSIDLKDEIYFLTTIHRQENTDDANRLKAIFEGLNLIAQNRQVVLPLHPRTKARLAQFALNHLLDDLLVIPPLSYLEMVALECHAALIITDSGGIQKEAFFHQIPCLTLRDETEWIELVEGEWNTLLKPSNAQEIYEVAMTKQGSQGKPISPYGQGQASQLIVQGIKTLLS
jgi:UDP-GlcNAc3NAcA epimerase